MKSKIIFLILKEVKLKNYFFYNLEDIKNENLKQDLIFYLNQNEELKKDY